MKLEIDCVVLFLSLKARSLTPRHNFFNIVISPRYLLNINRIWDYGLNDKALMLRGERPAGGGLVKKICSLCYINPHDLPLLASISEDGSVRVNSAMTGTLVTAWPAAPKQSNGNL